jgi:hypothetical protein
MLFDFLVNLLPLPAPAREALLSQLEIKRVFYANHRLIFRRMRDIVCSVPEFV